MSSVATISPAELVSATFWPGLSVAASSAVTGSEMRNRPGVELAVVFDDRFVEHAVVGLAIHRAGERAQRAVAKAIDGRQVGVRDGHLRQPAAAALKASISPAPTVQQTGSERPPCGAIRSAISRSFQLLSVNFDLWER